MCSLLFGKFNVAVWFALLTGLSYQDCIKFVFFHFVPEAKILQSRLQVAPRNEIDKNRKATDPPPPPPKSPQMHKLSACQQILSTIHTFTGGKSFLSPQNFHKMSTNISFWKRGGWARAPPPSVPRAQLLGVMLMSWPAAATDVCVNAAPPKLPPPRHTHTPSSPCLSDPIYGSECL